MSSEAPWIAVGRVARAHGVKGEVAVIPLSEVEARFGAGSRLFAGDSDARPLTVTASRPHHGRMLLRFDSITDRDAAEGLCGVYLFVPGSEIPTLPKDAYWPHELVGCEVVTKAGRSLGSVREVMYTPANDVWAVDGPDGETLIPALREVVVTVDVARRLITVAEVPGLTDTGSA